jgi:small subunit ribosomal protein S6
MNLRLGWLGGPVAPGVAIVARRPLGARTQPTGVFLMSDAPTLYDLVLLLSLESDEGARAKIVADVEAAIAAAGGSLARNQSWGRRPTTFRIRHQSEAEYHLLQFSGPTSLLESLSHTLRIADEVLRFRIIRVLPGTPEPPASAPPIVAGAVGGASAGGASAAAAAAAPAEAESVA